MVGMARAFSTSAAASFSMARSTPRITPRVAQVADQRAGIEIVDDRNAGAGQEIVGLGVGAPVAGDGRELAHHQTFDVGAGGFVIVGAGAVVADLRVGEDDDLAGIGRVGENFLIAGEGGIEDHLAGPFGGRTKTPALEDRAVFQGEDCRIQVRLFLPGSG